MKLYIITAVRFDKNSEVESVLWASANNVTNKFEGKCYQVGIDRVIEALDSGDVVEIHFETSHGWVSGGQLLKKVLPGGIENVIEQRGDEGRTLKDLPIF